MKFEKLENKLRHIAVDIETVNKMIPIDTMPENTIDQLNFCQLAVITENLLAHAKLIERTLRMPITCGFIERDEETGEYTLNGYKINNGTWLDFIVLYDCEVDGYELLNCNGDLFDTYDAEQYEDETSQEYFTRMLATVEGEPRMNIALETHITEDETVMVIPDHSIIIGDKEITGMFALMRN